MNGQRCNICGHMGIVEVHGHLQCSKCGALSESCCEGTGNICPSPPIEKDKVDHERPTG